MYKIGILFDIDALGGGLYGYEAYQVFFQAIDTRQLAGCSLSDGDTRATLAGRANHYCIAVTSLDAAKIAIVTHALSRSDAKGLLPLASRFVPTALVAREPLVTAAQINAAGELLGDRAGWVMAAWKKSREKHQGLESTAMPSSATPAEEEKVGKPSPPAPPRIARGPDEIFCTHCGTIIKKDAVFCPKCGVRVGGVRPGVGLKNKTVAPLPPKAAKVYRGNPLVKPRPTVNDRVIAPARGAGGTANSAAKLIGIILLSILLALVFLLGISMISMSLTATKPDPSAAASFKITDSLPKELFSMDKCVGFWNSNLRNGLAVYDQRGMNVNIVYPSAIKTIDRYWYGNNAYLVANGVKAYGSPDSKEKGWSDHISVSSTSEQGGAVSPSFSVTIPLSEKDIHEKVEIDAYMTVTYPSNNGNGTFSNPSEQLSKHYELFLVSQEDVALKEKLTNQKSQFEAAKDAWEHKASYLVIGLTFTGAPLLIAGIAYIVRKSSKAPKPV